MPVSGSETPVSGRETPVPRGRPAPVPSARSPPPPPNPCVVSKECLVPLPARIDPLSRRSMTAWAMVWSAPTLCTVMCICCVVCNARAQAALHLCPVFRVPSGDYGADSAAF